MKTKIFALGLIALLTRPLAAEDAKPEGRGVVNKVEAGAHKLNITHAAIPALHWPGMMMDFQAAPAVDLSEVKPGAKISFVLGRDQSGAYIIESVSAVKE